MVNWILKHKTRSGILAFFGGLFIVVASLYVDVFRGDTSGTMGLYQVVGALTGYIISGIGVALVMVETELRKTLQNILFYGGIIIIVVSVFADHLGVAGPSGFDKFQIMGLGGGIFIIAIGLFVFPQRFSSQDR